MFSIFPLKYAFPTLHPHSHPSYLRAALSISPKTDILDHIHSLPEPQQSEAQNSIRAIESEAMLSQEPQPGLGELIAYLESRNVRMALCTRNFEYVP